jgi:hypothetical protein
MGERVVLLTLLAWSSVDFSEVLCYVPVYDQLWAHEYARWTPSSGVA